jgi:hypothetical protein
MHRLAFLAAVASAVSLVAVAPAAAEQPVMFTESQVVTTPSSFNFTCVPYGYAFFTRATFAVERRYIQFYEGATLVKEIRHIDFEGTLYRSDDLAKTIPYAGKWTSTMYALEDLVVHTGLFRYSHDDGSGLIVLNAGRTEQKLTAPSTIYSDTGPTATEWQAGICAYLAAA